MRRVGVFLLLGAAVVLTTACDDGDDDPCTGEECSGHGTCEVVENSPACDCEPGYSPSGLACLPCEPQCDGRECGDDGCDGTCGPECDVGDSCSEAGACEPGAWVTVTAGSFTAGSPGGEPGRAEEREAQVEITLTRDFLIYSTEVTRDAFEELMGYDNSGAEGCLGRCPVDNVSWHEAAAYCNALSELEDLETCYLCEGSGESLTCGIEPDLDSPYHCAGYRLPTEAEWEYAARAGSTAATHAGGVEEADLMCDPVSPAMDEVAWYCGNSGMTAHQVGTREPNDWTLYDMHGNVSEHCHDGYEADRGEGPLEDPWGDEASAARAFRGGTWTAPARDCRAAARASSFPADRYNTLGIRVVRSLP